MEGIMSNDQTIQKIAILGTMPPIRALSSYCFELSRALSEIRHIEFISFKHIYPSFLYPGGDLENDHTYPAIERPSINIKRKLTWYNPLTWLSEGLFSRAKLLHAQWWSMPLFPIYLIICSLFRIRNKAVVFTVHNVLSHERSKLYSIFSGILFKLGNHFIVHTQTGRQQLINHYGIFPKNISVIPHGSLDFHVQENVNKNELKNQMGFAENEKIILIFGAIRPYKGIDTAIKAMAEIIRQIPDARLLIAGKLWEKWEPYDRLIKKYGLSKLVHLHLKYIPSNEVHKYFEISDLTIFPYHHFDSQSGAGAAAVSFRKPMVVSNVGGLPELVADKRCVVKPNDPNALANVVVSILKDPDMGQCMTHRLDRVAKQLDWADIAKKTVGVYENNVKNVKVKFI
jgi:glycosyltransferase involved in cell wall biosynthesis